jgi:hypothetical protein
MNLDRLMLLVAGSALFASMLLAWFHSPWWSLIAVVVSLDQIQAAFSHHSPVALLLRRAGAPVGPAYR